MKRVIIGCSLVLVLLAVMVAGCAAQPSEVITIKTNAFIPMQSGMMGFVPIVIDRLNAACEGQVVWENLGGPEIVTGLDQLNAAKGGTLGGVFTVAGYHTSDLPEAYSSSLSRLKPWEERESGYYDLLNELYQEQNVFYVGRFLRLPQYLQFVKPVENVDDMVGRKMRASGNQLPPWIKKLGMVPVETPPAETYTALERGIVDGMAYPCAGGADTGFYEVIKYVLDHSAYGSQNAFLLVNLDTWNKIPNKMQKTIVDTMAETEHEMVAWYDNFENAERQRIKDLGVTFVKFSAAEGQKVVDAAMDSAWEFQGGMVSPETVQKLRGLTGY